MLTRKTTKTLLIAAVVFITGAAVAFAQSGWGKGGGYRMGGFGAGYENCPNLRGADLTDEQIAAINAARDKFAGETESLRNDIRDKRTGLYEAMNAATPDREKVVELQRELSMLRADFDELAVQHRLEMRNLLPENATFGKGRGRGFGRGMGPCFRIGATE